MFYLLFLNQTTITFKSTFFSLTSEYSKGLMLLQLSRLLGLTSLKYCFLQTMYLTNRQDTTITTKRLVQAGLHIASSHIQSMVHHPYYDCNNSQVIVLYPWETMHSRRLSSSRLNWQSTKQYFSLLRVTIIFNYVLWY